MKLSRTDLISEIETLTNDLRVIDDQIDQETESHSHYGIQSQYQVGEYAFPYFEDQFDYDMFAEDISESLKAECDYDGDINYVEWSSKSGTSVFIDGFEFTNLFEDIVQNIIYEFDFEVGYNDLEDKEFPYSDLVQCRHQLIEYKEVMEADVIKQDAQRAKIEKIISSVALGTRSGSFSNGEVIFTPTKTYEGATEQFTPYYNPNEGN